MRVKIFIYLFLIILVYFSAAQESTEQKSSPYISRLIVTVIDYHIKLTWNAAKDFIGDYLIYRHSDEINADNFDRAKLIASEKSDTLAYLDTPLTTDEYYYAVLCRDEQNKLYEVFIPFRNITQKGISVDTPAPETALATRITNIDTQVSEDSILISFKSSRTTRDTLLFRNTSAIKTIRDLIRSTSPIRLDGKSTQYQDFPIPGVDYYYSVVDSKLFELSQVQIVPGENATIDPVQIQTQGIRIGLPSVEKTGRPIPLPYLLIDSEIESGTDLSPSSPFLLPSKKSVDPATGKALARLLSKIDPPRIPTMEIEILDIDRGTTSGGENYILQQIVLGALIEKDFQKTEPLLKNFLSIHRPPVLEARTHFYLAQTYFFRNRFREAFLEFLLAQDLYYKQVQSWLDNCYQKIIHENTD